MVKKTEKKDDNHQQDDTKLEEELEQGKEEVERDIQEIEDKLQEAEKELEKYKEVSTQAQSQYRNLKLDFDNYINRVEKEKEELDDNLFVENMKKLLPFIEEMRNSVEHIPSELEGNDWVEGMKMVYNNMMKKITELGVYPIESVGQTPDPTYHEPISTEEADKENKSKITKEYQRGYIYKGKSEEKVIQPAKVIVGQ